MGLILRTAVLTDLGLRRANNEDAAYAGHRLLAIADGMGGLPAGELASELAIHSLTGLDQPAGPGAGGTAHLTGAATGAVQPAEAGVAQPAAAQPAAATPRPAAAVPAAGAGAGTGSPAGVGVTDWFGPAAGSDPAVASQEYPDELVEALRAAFDEASDRIREAAAEDAVRDGMGTTVTALLFGTDRVGLMHIGDSRGYLFRDGELIQLTRDDTFVQALVDQGVITPEGARGHPQRSLVTKAMQGQPIAPFSTTLAVRVGDVFLLCSDGLSDVVADSMIAGFVRTRGDLEGCAASLVAAAVAAGGPDNVTVVLAEVIATG